MKRNFSRCKSSEVSLWEVSLDGLTETAREKRLNNKQVSVGLPIKKLIKLYNHSGTMLFSVLSGGASQPARTVLGIISLVLGYKPLCDFCLELCRRILGWQGTL